VKKRLKPSQGNLLFLGRVVVSAVLLAAKVKIDIRTHAEHDGHFSCACHNQCLRCLFSR
jgi:hypothetical protein